MTSYCLSLVLQVTTTCLHSEKALPSALPKCTEPSTVVEGKIDVYIIVLQHSALCAHVLVCPCCCCFGHSLPTDFRVSPSALPFWANRLGIRILYFSQHVIHTQKPFDHCILSVASRAASTQLIDHFSTHEFPLNWLSLLNWLPLLETLCSCSPK